MTNARSLANFATGIGTEGAVLTVDNTNNRIGIATTNPQNDLQVGLGITMDGDLGNVTFLGIVTASSYEGDGSNLTGITAGYWESTAAGINTSSAVGIGTTNPEQELHIQSSGGAYAIIQSTNSGSNTGILFGDSADNDIGSVIYENANDALTFTTNTVERLRILSDGTVKIGTGTGNPILQLSASTAGTSVIQMGDSADSNIGQIQYANSDDSMKFFANNAERLRIDSSGNVGIGTSISSSDGGRTLQIQADATPTLKLNQQNAFQGYIQLRGNDLEIRGSSGQMEFYTGNADGASSTQRLRITDDGHVGINTTVSGWESGADTTALQIDGAFVSCINDRDLFVGSNAYWDGSNWKYIQTGAAINYYHYTSGRGHVFRSAASGTAGNNISWTNQLEIDIAGNLDITGIATATQFDATSDVALKENIEVIDEPITKLSELKGVTFDWKKGGHSVGVIAQDVEKVLPTAVGGSKDHKTVNYNAIIGLLVESVKDQQKQIEELKSLLDK